MTAINIGTPTVSVNYEEASNFVECLYGPDAQLTFQTFDNSGHYLERPEKLHGTLDQHWKRLAYVNSRGLGVYTLVNRGDRKGRRTENITAITGLFLDLDRAPLEPVLNFPLRPNAIIQTRPDRYQVRWKLEPIPVNSDNVESARQVYYGVQASIARHFAGDEKNVDLARVARIPGFINHKKASFLLRTIELHAEPTYSIKDFIKAFDINLSNPLPPGRRIIPVDFDSVEPIPDGIRHDFVFSVASVLARRGVSPDVILETARRQNELRCQPPVTDADVRSQVKSVCNYWYSTKVNVGEIVSKLMEDHRLLWFENGFYRFDSKTGTYRASDVRRYRYRVQQETKKDTASPGDVARVICRLAEMVAADTPPSNNPELSFLSHHLPRGEKVVLNRLYTNYKDWCGSRGIKPVSQTELRQEVECRLNIKKTKIKQGKKAVWGFHIPNEG